MAAPAEAEKKDDKKDEKKDEPKDTVSVTEHTATIDGKEIKYKATAGKLVMKDDEGKTKALMFFIAYTKNGVEDLGQRPITFAFNGGPGSSSVWLHLGMLGPKRVKLPDDASQTPPPYALEANPHSLLDMTDLVFIDPVSTGFSRPAKGENDDQFHGFDEDLRSVGQFIHDYVTKYGRWRSPKFLLGESYGGMRAAGLSGYLRDRYNMAFNGVIMISPALNYETIGFAFGNDLPYILFVPGYAAAAWYHKALPGDLQALSLEDVVKQATEFALGEYTLAMMKGQTLSEDESERGGGKAGAIHGSVEGLCGARESANQHAAICEGAAARKRATHWTLRQPVQRHRRGRCGREAGIRRQRVGRLRAVHVGDQRLSAE